MFSKKAPRTSHRLIAVALFLCLPLNLAQAQTTAKSEKRVAIQELLNLIGATQTAKSIFVTLIDQYSQALAQDSIQKFEKQDYPPGYKEKVLSLTRDFYDGLSKRLREEVPQRIRYDERVNQMYVDAYDEYFSEAEVKDLIAFYKSPVGQKFLKLGPSVGTELQKKFQAELGPETMMATRAIVDEQVKQLEEIANREFKTSTGKKKE